MVTGLGWLAAGWSQPGPRLDASALAQWFGEQHTDLVWLDSSSGGAHLIGTGSERVIADGIDEVDALLRTDPGPWVGWFSYEAGVDLLPLPGGRSRTPRSRFPSVALLRLDQWAVLNEDGSTLLCARDAEWAWSVPEELVGAGGLDGRSFVAARPTREADVAARPTRHQSGGLDGRSSLAARPTMGDEQYAAMVRECIDHIKAGDAWVLCLTTAQTSGPIDAFASHLRLRELSPVPHGGLISIAGTTLSSASMEQFLSVHDGQVTTSPIKGTRRRSSDLELDRQLADDLRDSAKERAENVMIVDLCRNDLSQVCQPGSVTVPDLLEVRSYATVHQLVSRITGTLREGLGPVDALRAMFPAGSMTGAPKVRAVEILADLEQQPRGVYSGCFGVISGDHAELAMVIRSVVSDAEGAHLGVGGGITVLSDVDDEVAEIHLKCEALRRCLIAADGRRPFRRHR